MQVKTKSGPHSLDSVAAFFSGIRHRHYAACESSLMLVGPNRTGELSTLIGMHRPGLVGNSIS